MNYDNNEDIIVKFVEDIRGDSIIDRAKNVMTLALKLYDIEFEANRYPMGLYYPIKVIALLYHMTIIDESDELEDESIIKYEKYYLQKQLEEFIYRVLPVESCILYLDIIERISYESEVKMREELGGQTDWLQILGDFGIFIRDIVSDADKIVFINHEKLVEQNREKHKFSNGEEKELFKCVDKIINEKIAHIVKYIRTKSGRKLGIQKRSDLYIAHEDWRKKLYPQKKFEPLTKLKIDLLTL